MIRFDFRRGESEDLRLVTGSGGHYNTIVHIRPNHFFIQTAKDDAVPYFSFRHGECAFEFEPDRWYTMTVEFFGDEAIAHVDPQHIAHARHPIIERTREYFALQVDQHAAQFDNLQIFDAVARRDRPDLTDRLDLFPVPKSPEEALSIRKTNAHEWLYQNDASYRARVLRVDELDAENKRRFPEVYRTHKEAQKAMQARKKALQAGDPSYKEKLQATHQAKREIEVYLLAQNPEVEALPSNRRKAEIERLKGEYQTTAEFKKLQKQADSAQATLEAAYPELFITNEAISAQKQAAQETAKSSTEFRTARVNRASAYRDVQDYIDTYLSK